MSRESNIKSLKHSLHNTQEILNDLVKNTGKDADKRLTKANKRLQKNFEHIRHDLEDIYDDTSKDVRKRYSGTVKDLDKKTERARYELKERFSDGRAAARTAKASLGAGALALAAKADLASRAANAAAFLAKTGLAAKAVKLATKADLKNRTAGLLEGAAGGFVAARNKLNTNNRLVIKNEGEKTHVSKTGYFLRYSALAVIIISKRHKLMELGTQLYDKLKDSEGRASLTQDAKDQFDTMRRLMKAYANGQYREFPYRSLVKIVAAVIYFVSVADLIPDFIPLLGLTDDLAILAWVFSSVKDDLQQFVDWEAAEEKRQSRLAKQSGGSSSSKSSDSSMSSSTYSAGSASANNTVANAGSPSAATDRKASPNASTTTGSDTGSKISVTTGTSGESASDRTPTSGNRSTTGGSQGNSGGSNLS